MGIKRVSHLRIIKWGIFFRKNSKPAPEFATISTTAISFYSLAKDTLWP